MICSYCSTELPAGAMFCGECGRPVTAQTAVVAAPAPPAEVPTTEASVDRCAQCGAVLDPAEIFCGECGFVRQGAAQRPRDTVLLDPFPWGSAAVIHEQLITEPVIHDPVIREPVRPGAGVRATAEVAASEVAAAAPAPAPAEAALAPAEAAPAPAEAAPALAEPQAQAPELSTPELSELELSEPDIGETRIVDRSRHGDRFVLQFSTGESVSVTGSGLLGRNPLPEPGEYFDSIVVISDPGRSVSKTHLEFGQDSGVFWVSDRYSGNGTVLREPESQPRRCDAGKRYRVVRGTRVDIGEQFFIVS